MGAGPLDAVVNVDVELRLRRRLRIITCQLSRPRVATRQDRQQKQGKFPSSCFVEAAGISDSQELNSKSCITTTRFSRIMPPVKASKIRSMKNLGVYAKRRHGTDVKTKKVKQQVRWLMYTPSIASCLVLGLLLRVS